MDTSQFQAALQSWQQALAIYKEIGDKEGEADSLNNLGRAYNNLGQYQKAIEFSQQSLAIAREIGSRQVEAKSLRNLGRAYDFLGQYQKAIEFFQQSLAIAREIGDRQLEAYSLNNLGNAYNSLGQYQKAIEFYQQSLAIARDIDDRAGEAYSLGGLGSAYNNLGQYQKAIEFYQQSLAIAREIGDRSREASSLGGLGVTYYALGQYQKAIEFHQQQLAIAQEIGDRSGEAYSLGSLGVAYNSLGQYQKAIEFHQQSLAIEREIGDRSGEAGSLVGLGNAYLLLGQYQKAIEFYQQSLAIAREIGDQSGEAGSLENLGMAYRNLGQYQKAIEFYQQSLAIAQEIGNRLGESRSLGSLGNVYYSLGQYRQAIEFHQQSLAMAREIGDRLGESRSLGSLGAAYDSLGQYRQAIEFHQQSLAIKREIGDRAGEGLALNNIGLLLAKQNQPELAIIFYKQSVNVTEAIRQDIRGLSKEQQQSYTETIAGTYRRLADLLLKQDRVLEAQKVLDLLKVQELEDYLSNVRGNEQTATGVPNLPPEEQFNQSYTALINKAIELGKELTQLEGISEANRTPQQQQRVTELRNQQTEIVAGFNTFIRSDEVEKIVEQLSQTARRQNVELEDLNSLRDNLRNLQQNAVLLYPLILDDRLELVLVTADSPPIHRSVPVKHEDLNRAIAQFRTALENPTSDAETPARQLYDWLIKPIENDLTQANAQTIIYAPDGQLRYIPLAALHDGKQWLAQRWRVNNITAKSLTDFDTQPQSALRVLAAAFTQGSYNFQVGNQDFSFNGLPFAGVEVENLVTALPGTTKLLDKAFSREGTVSRMNDYNIVHLATHAAFVTGKPEDSFVLFGNGDRMTLRDIENLTLPNVDLIVFSACETGVGGFGNGEEILGLGYQVQRTGARAAIASLWSVDDGGTQALMNAFYAALQNGMSKAEALRQAQIALITKDLSAVGGSRGEAAWIEVLSTRTGLPLNVSNNLSHPYYWAPFILIGNGM